MAVSGPARRISFYRERPRATRLDPLRVGSRRLEAARDARVEGQEPGRAVRACTPAPARLHIGSGPNPAGCLERIGRLPPRFRERQKSCERPPRPLEHASYADACARGPRWPPAPIRTPATQRQLHPSRSQGQSRSDC